METLMLLSILLDREPNYDRITHGLLDGMNIRLVMLRRRSWSARFFSSYKDWRKYLGVKSSIHAAWRISR
jgi:hypothetical protein